MNKMLLIILLFSCLCVYADDSILVDKEWIERGTVLYCKNDIDSIGEDSIIEDIGIPCGYDGCVKIEFLSNKHFKKTYPYGEARLGTWKLNGDTLVIIYDKRKRLEKRKYKFKIKYRLKKECPTLYLFEINGIACNIYCNYK